MQRKECIYGRGIGTALFLTAVAFVLISSPFPASAGQEGPRKAAALLREADTLSREGNTDKAIVTLKSAIAADPENSGAYDRLGYMLLRKGRADDAANAFTSALGIQANLGTAKTGLGLALLQKGDLKAAEKELTAALSLNPYPSMTHYALGLVYEKMNDYGRAIIQFKEGIKTFKDGRK